jgi:hypothetical protein
MGFQQHKLYNWNIQTKGFKDKIKIYKTIILPGVFYVSEDWFLTKRENI